MKRTGKIVLYACMTALAAGCISAYFIYSTYFKANILDEQARIFIDTDDTSDSVAVKLEDAHILISQASFERAAKQRLEGKDVKTGCYSFKKGRDNRFIINSFLMGWQTPVRITIAGNIRNIERLSSILSRQILADSSSIYEIFSKKFAGEKGLLKIIPETYEVYWTVTPGELASRLTREYELFWNETRKHKAEDAGLTPEEAGILASIVAEESNVPSELPVIAGVYINRLKNGIPLQADPTVKFATGDPTIKRILYKHLETDSPYNTYKYKGLPPGPITIPSVQAIEAVLNYQKHDFMYFCADASLNGTHKFAETLSEHNRNAKEYQKAISALGL